jgi:hypothetical protein
LVLRPSLDKDGVGILTDHRQRDVAGTPAVEKKTGGWTCRDYRGAAIAWRPFRLAL